MSEAKVKYKADNWGIQIKEVEIENESADMVWPVGAKPEKKKTGMWQYFDTWEEAHQSLLKQAEDAVDNYEVMLGYKIARLEKVQGLKRPE